MISKSAHIFCLLTSILAPLSYSGDFTVLNSGYTSALRSTGTRLLPIAVNESGEIFGSYGTSVNDDVFRINPDGTTSVLSLGTGKVIGVLSDFTIGFNGDIFANVGSPTSLYIDGLLRINTSTGASSMFWTSPSDQATSDGGMFYDGQNLFAASNVANDSIRVFNSDGTFSILSPNIGAVLSMDDRGDGTLLALLSSGIVTRINKATGAALESVNLNLLADNVIEFMSLEVVSDRVFVTARYSGTSGERRRIYSLSLGLQDLNLIAEGNNILNLTEGPSSMITGQRALFVSSPWARSSSSSLPDEVYELNFVPEPNSTLMLFLPAYLYFKIGANRRTAPVVSQSI